MLDKRELDPIMLTKKSSSERSTTRLECHKHETDLNPPHLKVFAFLFSKLFCTSPLRPLLPDYLFKKLQKNW